MVLIPKGSFLMGTNGTEGFVSDFEGPVREVEVESFWIDQYAVTNKQFNEFIEETKYITDAERYGWSFVFHLLVDEGVKSGIQYIAEQTPWWWMVNHANWKQPEGLGSTIENRMNHPVVHISWKDANAYCQWAGKRLPFEEEWEYAARGGLEQALYPWGNELLVKGEHQCNIWQGEFPHYNTGIDGFIGTAPVDSYSANGFGLYNVSGNVWEWCQNSFTQGKSTQDGNKAIRGGSYLCHDSYCNRYRVAARSFNSIDSSTGHLGFRCVANLEGE
ncbi:hypothetical protein BTS2_1806 [Bacillus sp. TS-2]|nr:hypothetical protein BTS2_1806 [Bacillus sp. TS-2]